MERAGHIFADAARLRRRLGAGLAALVWPPVCMGCRADVSDPHGLCAGCWADLRLASGPQCPSCAHPLPEIGEDDACKGCTGMRLAWGRTRTATFYGGTARSLILSLKHGDRTDLAVPMARWMRRAGDDILSRADLVIPVPLHWTRRVRRRFNQSAELSRRIAAEQGVDHGAGLVQRTRATGSQKGLSPEQRRANVAGAFACPSPDRVEGRRIVLVDDVMTTGATLNAASHALRKSGAASVDVLVFARVTQAGDVLF